MGVTGYEVRSTKYEVPSTKYDVRSKWDMGRGGEVNTPLPPLRGVRGTPKGSWKNNMVSRFLIKSRGMVGWRSGHCRDTVGWRSGGYRQKVGELMGKIELFPLELNISNDSKCAFFGGKMYVPANGLNHFFQVP
jgi:hypothetical protein